MVVQKNDVMHEWDDAIRAAWEPRLRLPVSVWADRYRVLHTKYAAEAGPYRTSRTPYLREFMDTFADPEIRLIVFTKSARVGGTEAVNNMLGYAIDEEPGPVLYVYPTQDDAEEECKDRLIPFIEGSPRLLGHCPSPAWGTKSELKLDTMNVYMAWAHAPRTLIRRTCRYFFVDEIDNCDAQSGSLGDTLTLCQKRTITFRDRAKGVVVSTPTTEEGAAYRSYQQSDKREYHVPCPNCGKYQALDFYRIRVPKGERDSDKIEIDGLAWYECIECEAKLRNAIKRWMVERGVWLAEGEEIVQHLPIDNEEIVASARFDAVAPWRPKIRGERKRTRVAGFHINALYSPFVDWSEIIAEWFRAQEELKRGNPEPMRTFVNSMLGEPWRETAEEVKPREIEEKREQSTYSRDEVPEGVIRLIAGADVQKNRIYYVIRGWGPRRTSWLIREGVCATFEELYAFCSEPYYRKNSAEYLNVELLAIDSGYRTFEVYDFARAYPGVVPCKGQVSMDTTYRPKDISYSRPGRAKKARVTLWHINTSAWKEAMYRLMKIEQGEPGAWYVHSEVTDDYCKQVTSERQVWKDVTVGNAKRRRLVWEPRTTHAQNHYLDAEVYGMAMAAERRMLNMDPEAAMKKSQAMDKEQEKALKSLQDSAQKSTRRLASHSLREARRSRTQRSSGRWSR